MLSLATYNGALYVGGYYSNAGGIATNYISKWDGTTWSTLATGVNQDVHALLGDSTALYLAGSFTNCSGVNANYIAKWTDGTGIKEITNENNFVVYPNPFRYETTLHFTAEMKNTTIKLFDLLGKELRSFNFSGNNFLLKKEALQGGIYFLGIFDDNKSTFVKISIE